MRLLVGGGVVILGLLAFALPRGASFSSWRDALRVGEIGTGTGGRPSPLPWVAGAALGVGVALSVARMRKRV